MSIRLENLSNQTIVSMSGRTFRLTKMVGLGTQGVVYEESTNKYMVKIYHPSNCMSVDYDIIERLKFIKDVKTPKNFVRIVDILEFPYSGYVMEKIVDHKSLNSYLIPEKGVSFSEWYNKGLGLYERLYIGYIIAKSFGELEKSNLSYCDISGNNILIKTNKGASVKMIDIDNIYIAGKGQSMVIGTPRFIAPEIVSRQRNPDVLSDNYSLAVILFELLRVWHPYLTDDVLEGTPEEEEEALSGRSDYINDSNSTNMLPADVVFTNNLKELFKRAFVDGKHNRMNRPSAIEFENALLEASNKVIMCPSCKAWYYPRKTGKTYENCPWCDHYSKPKAVLNFYDMLFDGDNYQNGLILGDNPSGKHINSYVLKESRKNFIKSLYILRSDNFSTEKRSSENYLTIAHDQKGFYAYNEFSKSGIIIKKFNSKEYKNIDFNKAVLLQTGDEIYFNLTNSSNIECGGKRYTFKRMMRFLEV